MLERALTRCDHLEHIESRSLLGIGIIKVYFRSEVDPDVAASQVISLVNGEMQNMPPGMLPPSIFKYDATAIPVGNLVISSNSRDDRELLDLADHDCATSWPASRAWRRRRSSAASSARCKSTSTRARSRPASCRPWTWPASSTPRAR